MLKQVSRTNMTCSICGDEMKGISHGVVVLEDGIAHSGCIKDRQAQELEKEFPDADKYFIRNLQEVDVQQFKSHKYCLQVSDIDLDDRTCGGAYVSLEFFDDERELSDYLRNEIFDNCEYTHKWVSLFHVDQKKTEFKFSVFYGGIEKTGEYLDLQDQLDAEKDYLTSMKENNNYFREEVDINNLIWMLDTSKVQELLTEIVNSHHFQHLDFAPK